MRSFVTALCLVAGLVSCKQKPGFHEYADIETYWRSSDTIQFVVEAKDTTELNTLSLEVRNSSDYEWSRFFAGFEIMDSVGHQLDSGLVSGLLFDPVTGKARGESGIGDLFENEILIRNDFRFPYRGKFTIQFWQMMRRDSLEGIQNIGVSLMPKTLAGQ